MTSTVLARVCSAMLATPTSESVSAGSAMWRSASAKVTSAERVPMGAENPMGNHPSPTPSATSSTSPTQNVGIDASTKQ